MDYKESLENEYANEIEKLKKNKPNLMLIGGSGVGKSSLINRVFGKNVAKVGTGKPVTERIEVYKSDASLINIYDTIGYETKYESDHDLGCDRFENTVISELKNRKDRSLQEQIHIIWYCISIQNHRIFNYDISNIISLSKFDIPVLIVFMQCDEDEEDAYGNGVISAAFKNTLHKANIDNKIYETSAISDVKFDLDLLLEDSYNSLDDDNLRKAFAAAQISNLKLKKSSAHTIIHSASVSSGLAASVPLPGADAPVISGIQLTMSLALAKLYGFTSFSENTRALLKTQILSLLGKQLVASLAKFIPVLGSAINAAVAVSFTEALGWGLVSIYENVLEEYLKTGKEPVWSQIFSSDILIDFIKQKMNGLG